MSTLRIRNKACHMYASPDINKEKKTMKESYKTVEMEVIIFETKDIITSSCPNEGDEI